MIFINMDIVTKQFNNSLDQMLASAPDNESKMEILNMQSNVNQNAESTEATSSAGSGQYSVPLFSMFQDGKKKVDNETPRDTKSSGGVVKKKIEAKEATGASSAGSYESPAFLAKSMNKKNWRGAAKPLYKGGKFVRVKKKCKTFPYCNQGDIKALELWEDDVMTEAIKNVAKNKKVHENVVRAIVLHVIEEQLFND
jgi:hypothetical protein